MKINLQIFFSAILLFAPLAQAGEFEYGGYMRAPVGTNSSGGKQIQLTNPGSQGNEFRLGNETGYGEAYFTQHFFKSLDKKAPFFDAHLTFAYNPSMNSQYSDTSTTGDYIQFVEAYAKGGNLGDVPLSFWAGKRFYRDADIHMNDFFYFANMSGNGGGVEDIPVSNGTLAVALLQYADDRTLNNSTTGNPAKHALDLRWKELALSESDQLHLWFVQAYTAPGKGKIPSTGTTVDYQASSGNAIGARWRHSLSQGNNDLALVYGTGVMESLTLDSTAFASDDSVKKRRRLRLVENYSTELSEKWAIQAAAVYEDADSGASTANKSNWTSLGVRPLYYFSNHYRIQGELGYSVVRDDSEVDGSGNAAGNRNLTRLTIAPEVAFGKGYYTRPVIRFYVTYSSWNAANKDASNPKSLIGKLNSSGGGSIVSLNGKSSETQTGFQAEVWF